MDFAFDEVVKGRRLKDAHGSKIQGRRVWEVFSPKRWGEGHDVLKKFKIGPMFGFYYIFINKFLNIFLRESCFRPPPGDPIY